ncbi:MAG: polymer-forming cytoskeletal protein, partial [Bdellovibrionales bacterium]|nr:polymer-forming cytoskeletal protein [Bdellovibrionales bacterium]
VVGTLTFTGPVELDGYVEGELNADKLTIGEAAVIKAKVRGAEITVKGSVTGDIIASKKLMLKKPAKVVGNITSSNLSIEEGVVFEGQCSMNSEGQGPGRAASSDKVAALK